jgi:tetratricopeptide (TPR) repeat protein
MPGRRPAPADQIRVRTELVQPQLGPEFQLRQRECLPERDERARVARAERALPQAPGTAAARPDVAAHFLEALAARRALSPQEESWLAGQYRAAGQHEAALAAYERAVASQSSADPVSLEAIADLRYDTRDYRGALDALQRIGAARDVRLKRARAAAAAGELQLAAQSYDEYGTDHPHDVEARLETARFFAAMGQSGRAIPYYREVVERRSAQDLRAELARVYLGAEEFGAAEGWGRLPARPRFSR